MSNETTLEFDVELPPADKPALMQVIFSYASLSKFLRVLGAGVLLTSVSIFLFKGWGDGNDLERYIMLLVHTVLLAMTGVVVGNWLKESKGARLFLGLSLISTVVNFAVLGGLLYSQTQWDGGLAFYPSFATWKADSFTEAITTTGIAWLLLAPVAWFSFMAMARRSAGRLTVLFMFSCTALLLPVRQTEMVAVLVAGLTLMLLMSLIRVKRADASLATLEGRFARLITFAGPVILLSRGMYLYSADILMVTVVASLVFIAMRQMTFDTKLPTGVRQSINAISLIPVLVAAYGAATQVCLVGPLSAAAWLPVFGLIVGGLLLDVSMRDFAGGVVYRRMASLVIVCAMLANLSMYPAVSTALVCLVSGVVVMIYGYSCEQRIDFIAGVITLLAGVGYQCVLAFDAFDFGSWGTLAAIGVLAIVAGSVLERHGAIIRARVAAWQSSFKKWQY